MQDAKSEGLRQRDGAAEGIDDADPTREERARRCSAIVTSGDAELADAIVTRICRITRDRTLEHALEIGEIIAQGVYEGNANALAVKGESHPLYRRIAAHPSLPFTAKQLWICVKIHELLLAHPQFRSKPNLGVAHLRAVLNLPGAVQERLLASASVQGWTSDRLEAEASAFRRKSRQQGRSKAVVLCRTISSIERFAKQVHSKISRASPGVLAGDRLAIARESLQRARESLDEIDAEITRRAAT